MEVINTMLAYYSVDPDLKVEIFFVKKGTTGKWGGDRGLGHLLTLTLGIEENFMQILLALFSVSCTFIP